MFAAMLVAASPLMPGYAPATKTLRKLGFANLTSANMVFESGVMAGQPAYKPK